MKEILAFADGADEQARARVEAAWAIVQRSDAHLEALRFAPLPEEPYAIATPSFAEAYDRAVALSRAEADAALARISAAIPLGARFSAYAPGAPYARIRAAAGAAARSCDLAVVGQPETGDGTALDTEILLGALVNGGAPCLVLPRWETPHAWGRRALVAWKGTPEAARAVRAAMPFLQQAERVHFLVIDPRTEWEGEDVRALRRLVTYAARHGVKTEDPIIAASGGLEHGPEAAIASELERIGGDLLVMGGYGHARWAHFIMGGVTGALIRTARTPILIAH